MRTSTPRNWWLRALEMTSSISRPSSPSSAGTSSLMWHAGRRVTCFQLSPFPTSPHPHCKVGSCTNSFKAHKESFTLERKFANHLTLTYCSIGEKIVGVASIHHTPFDYVQNYGNALPYMLFKSSFLKEISDALTPLVILPHRTWTWTSRGTYNIIHRRTRRKDFQMRYWARWKSEWKGGWEWVVRDSTLTLHYPNFFFFFFRRFLGYNLE